MHDLDQKLNIYDSDTKSNILSWMRNDLTLEERSEILKMLDQDPSQLEDRFRKHLTFGTGGLRGLVGFGTNRMNIFNVRKATQGLANYILSSKEGLQEVRVVISYDTRLRSLEFAEETAKVLAANRIEVLLFKDPRPIALLSFAIRFYQCAAGIMITASHNPPEYNGYKVYMSSGGQVIAPYDQMIVDQVNQVSSEDIVVAPSMNDSLIKVIGAEFDQEYIKCIDTLQNYPQVNHDEGSLLNIVYSPIHGSGRFIVPEVLDNWGFDSLRLVESQLSPDGNFPTVKLPNPEDIEALSYGISLLRSSKSDVLFATDPDADRVGVACLLKDEVYVFSGNQIACLLADHILKATSEKRSLSKNDVVIKSLVTTDMLSAITEHYGVSLYNVLTGFKYIGEKIESWRHSEYTFLFGAEESLGYLSGTHVADKDAVSAIALISEMALQWKKKGMSLKEGLCLLYERFGYFLNKTESVTFLGKAGEVKMKSILTTLSDQLTKQRTLSGKSLSRVENYSIGMGYNFVNNEEYKLSLDKTSMLCYYLSDGGKVIVRPSGTEPKMKIYFELVNNYSDSQKDFYKQIVREQESEKQLLEWISLVKKDLDFVDS